jgi:hypothetical protein
MISPTSNADQIRRPELTPVTGKPVPSQTTVASDQFSSDSTTRLKASLNSQPDIRPEVLARAKALAADPDYPSKEIMRDVARQILAAPDLSEIDS